MTIPPNLLAFEPEHTASLSTSVVAQTLREARRGAAPGLSGARPEHFKLLLADADGLELPAYAASALAKARVPPVVSAALALARMTALRKPDGGVRGIATGDVFRRPGEDLGGYLRRGDLSLSARPERAVRNGRLGGATPRRAGD